MRPPIATAARVRRATAAALRHYGVHLSPAEARAVVRADAGHSFVRELSDDLDTAPREYLGMALIEVLMPGPPTVRDDFLWGQVQDRWHWPLNGSSAEYTRAFWRSWRAVLASKRQKPAR